MNLPDAQFDPLLASDRNDGVPPIVNIGIGHDLPIADLARLVAETVGYSGAISLDRSKPDGTPRKLMDTSRLTALGWRAKTELADGLKAAYTDFLAHTT
jgi:GDP-L-fucose synthase